MRLASRLEFFFKVRSQRALIDRGRDRMPIWPDRLISYLNAYGIAEFLPALSGMSLKKIARGGDAGHTWMILPPYREVGHTNYRGRTETGPHGRGQRWDLRGQPGIPGGNQGATKVIFVYGGTTRGGVSEVISALRGHGAARRSMRSETIACRGVSLPSLRSGHQRGRYRCGFQEHQQDSAQELGSRARRLRRSIPYPRS